MLPPTKGKPPLGLIVLLIYTGLFYGLLPIASRIVFPFSRYYNLIEEMPFAVLTLTVAPILGIGVILSVIGTWKGNVKTRNVFVCLLVVLSLTYLISIVGTWAQNSRQAITGAMGIIYPLQTMGSVVRHLLTPLLAIWYFRQQNAKIFFADGDRPDQPDVHSNDARGITVRHVLAGSIIIVLVYRFICAIPFPEEGVLPMIANAPEFPLSVLLGRYIHVDQSILLNLIASLVSTFLWFMIGATLVVFVRRVRWIILICIVLEGLLMAGVYFWLIRKFSNFLPI